MDLTDLILMSYCTELQLDIVLSWHRWPGTGVPAQKRCCSITCTLLCLMELGHAMYGLYQYYIHADIVY